MFKARCPHCNAPTDDYTPVGRASKPDAGSVSLCIYCLGIAVYTGEGLLTRKPTREELVDIMADEQVIGAIRAMESWVDRPGPWTSPITE